MKSEIKLDKQVVKSPNEFTAFLQKYCRIGNMKIIKKNEERLNCEKFLNVINHSRVVVKVRFQKN